MIDCSNTSGICTSGGSRPSEKDGGMGGGGGLGCAHRDPQIKQWGGGGGLLSKNFFPLFGPQFGLKNNKGGRWAPPQDLPLCTLQVHNSHG